MRILTLTTVIIVTALLAVWAQSCTWSPVSRDSTTENTGNSDSRSPFQVKDPERFSAEIIIESFNGGTKSARRYFVAIDGKRRLEKFGVGTTTEFHVLTGLDGKSYRLNPARKEYELLALRSVSSKPDSLKDSLISRWLSENKSAEFTDLGMDGRLRRYRVDIEGTKNTETFVFVDEDLKYPVRQEMYSVEEGKRELTFRAELRSISTDPEPGLFELPEGYTEKQKARSLEE